MEAFVAVECMLKSDFMVVFIFLCKIDWKESEYFWSFINKCCATWLTDCPPIWKSHVDQCYFSLVCFHQFILLLYSVSSRNMSSHHCSLLCPHVSEIMQRHVWDGMSAFFDLYIRDALDQIWDSCLQKLHGWNSEGNQMMVRAANCVCVCKASLRKLCLNLSGLHVVMSSDTGLTFLTASLG